MTGLPAYRDSRWRAERELCDGATVCEETGAAAVKGVCPVHGGDACLYSSALLVTYWRERFLASGGSGEAPAGLTEADDLLRRLAEWDVMQATGDGPYWKREIARVRAALRGASPGEVVATESGEGG